MTCPRRRVTYYQGADLADLDLWWVDQQGALIDFSSGWSFLVEVGKQWRAALVSKSAGVVGAAGSGTPDTGTPNVSIVWAVAELDAVAPGDDWIVEVTATNGAGKNRKVQVDLTIIAEVEALVP